MRLVGVGEPADHAAATAAVEQARERVAKIRARELILRREREAIEPAAVIVADEAKVEARDELHRAYRDAISEMDRALQAASDANARVYEIRAAALEGLRDDGRAVVAWRQPPELWWPPAHGLGSPRPEGDAIPTRPRSARRMSVGSRTGGARRSPADGSTDDDALRRDRRAPGAGCPPLHGRSDCPPGGLAAGPGRDTDHPMGPALGPDEEPAPGQVVVRDAFAARGWVNLGQRYSPHTGWDAPPTMWLDVDAADARSVWHEARHLEQIRRGYTSLAYDRDQFEADAVAYGDGMAGRLSRTLPTAVTRTISPIEASTPAVSPIPEVRAEVAFGRRAFVHSRDVACRPTFGPRPPRSRTWWQEVHRRTLARWREHGRPAWRSLPVRWSPRMTRAGGLPPGVGQLSTAFRGPVPEHSTKDVRPSVFLDRFSDD